MDEDFPLNFNDVDLCLRLRRAGLRTVVDNQTVLTHLETSSRSTGSETWEVERFLSEWPPDEWGDPWDNPNFIDVGMEHVPAPPALVKLRELRQGKLPARVIERLPSARQ